MTSVQILESIIEVKTTPEIAKDMVRGLMYNCITQMHEIVEIICTKIGRNLKRVAGDEIIFRMLIYLIKFLLKRAHAFGVGSIKEFVEPNGVSECVADYLRVMKILRTVATCMGSPISKNILLPHDVLYCNGAWYISYDIHGQGCEAFRNKLIATYRDLHRLPGRKCIMASTSLGSLKIKEI